MTAPLERPVRPGATADPDAGAYGGPAERPPTGSTVAGSQRAIEPRRRRTPLAWLPWAALAGIALLLLLSLLAINAVDDDGPQGPAGDSLGQASRSGGSGASGSAGSSGGPAGGSPQGATGSGGGLAAGGQDVIAVAAAGGLAGLVGQPVTGSGRVESVVSDEGFWVGTSARDRVFVFLTPQARQSSGESGFQVTAGQTISITGAVQALATAPTVADGVADSEGRAQLGQQAHFVRADAVQLR